MTDDGLGDGAKKATTSIETVSQGSAMCPFFHARDRCDEDGTQTLQSAAGRGYAFGMARDALARNADGGTPSHRLKARRKFARSV